MGWYKHTILYKAGTGQPSSVPDAIVVTPKYTLSEAIFKSLSGTRYRKRHGIWAGCKIRWQLGATELSSITSMLTVEQNDCDSTPFYLSLDGGTTYYRAHLAQDPEIKPLQDKNAGLEITLEFEFVTRISSMPSNLHLGSSAS